MPPVRFEPTISADERPKSYALDRAATGTAIQYSYDSYLQLVNKVANSMVNSHSQQANNLSGA